MPPKARAPKVTKVPKQVYTHWLLKAEPDSRIVKGIDGMFIYWAKLLPLPDRVADAEEAGRISQILRDRL